MEAVNINNWPDGHEYTTDDIMKLPEDARVELIDGKIYDMATPAVRHQRLAGEIYFQLRKHIEENPETCGGCEAFIAPIGVFLTKDKRTFLEPDVLVVCKPKKISKRGIEGAPDFVVEVVSPSDRGMDYVKKLRKYMESGVRLYWIVDPTDNTVTVYDLEEDSIEKYRFKDSLPVKLCEGLEIDIAGV